MPNGRKLIMIGASGHGRVCADIAELMGYTDIVFLDDAPHITSCAGYPVVGSVSEANNLEGDLFIAIGNAQVRRRITEANSGRVIATLIHPSAVVARSASVGAGSVLMAGAVINPGVTLGRGVIINTCASVDHDSTVCDYVHVAVGAHLCGTVTVGEGTWVGAGAVVNNNVKVCPGVTVGTGAAVVRDITLPGTYVGVPARLIERKRQDALTV